MCPENELHSMLYSYDYGDGWEHEIRFEGMFPKAIGTKYPICLSGELACPPEDVGGMGGFHEYVKIMSDKKHPEYQDYLEWRGKFNPNKFEPKKVKFHNPNIRLKQIMENM